jgi:2-polyprenyl-3-methyl-5-hydroxy-6-metoxy-1,4-benzoquinol methylase
MREGVDLQVLLDALRCPECSAKLSAKSASFDRDAESALECQQCSQRFSIRNAIPRMLSSSMRDALGGQTLRSDVDRRQVSAAQSFGYEWERFPDMYQEWERNFLEYMSPHTPDFFRGKRVLDAGCGGGRHAHYAAKSGAEVWAVDLGAAVEVAKANNRSFDNAHVAQADLHHLPFEPESFDLVYSIGVLHHLPDPESAFRNLLRYIKPGGWIQIYLYWKPENQPVKRALLSLVTAARQVTTRIPHRLLYGLSFPAAAIAFAGFVWPYQLLTAAGLNEVAERMPMKQYAKYPFRVCVNDQFDRLSAPIEFRYTRDEVEGWMRRAELEEVIVSPNYGWRATGRKPARP